MVTCALENYRSIKIGDSTLRQRIERPRTENSEYAPKQVGYRYPVLGIMDKKGSLKPGLDGDLVVLDEAGNVPQVWKIWKNSFRCC